jgi:hypothetical protein
VFFFLSFYVLVLIVTTGSMVRCGPVLRYGVLPYRAFWGLFGKGWSGPNLTSQNPSANEDVVLTASVPALRFRAAYAGTAGLSGSRIPDALVDLVNMAHFSVHNSARRHCGLVAVMIQFADGSFAS